MKYRAIRERSRRYPIRLMCPALVVSPAGYYAWSTRPESARCAANRVLRADIRVIHRERRETSGSPSIWQALMPCGHRIGQRRVARLMRTDGLRANTVKTWRTATQSNHRGLVAANRLNRQFTPAHSPTRVCGRRHHLRLDHGRVALFGRGPRPLCARRGGLGNGHPAHGRAITAAQTMAIHHRAPRRGCCPLGSGGQYAATTDPQLLTTHGITARMRRTGNCWDNACVESFFGT